MYISSSQQIIEEIFRVHPASPKRSGGSVTLWSACHVTVSDSQTTSYSIRARCALFHNIRYSGLHRLKPLHWKLMWTLSRTPFVQCFLRWNLVVFSWMFFQRMFTTFVSGNLRSLEYSVCNRSNNFMTSFITVLDTKNLFFKGIY